MENKYPWKFCSLGGVTRVKISSGEDIAHLGELDLKLWTVLSCPVDGLIFDRKTLEYLDTDKDGKIRVGEVVSAARWITSLIKDKDLILKGSDTLPLEQINTGTPDGERIATGAKRILESLGRGDRTAISLADTAECVRVTTRKKVAEDAAAPDGALPYGEGTQAALDAVEAVRSKVEDYFLRCRLVAFNPESAAALDTSSSKIAAFASDDLNGKVSEIAACPLAHPASDSALHLDRINPAWTGAIAKLKSAVLDTALPGKESITECDWNGIVSGFDAYKAWVAAKSEVVTDDCSAMADEVDKLLHLYRWFYDFLCNYVIFSDFYNITRKAVFEAGKLYLDQRCLELCIDVADMGKHADMASLSGMYIIYCNCVSKKTGKTANIAAILTDGDVDNLRVGMNCVYYDRDGLDYDAVITKLVDNPVSVRQAFWAPYKKLARTITDRINKNAAEKDAKATSELTGKAATFNLPDTKDAAAPAQNFDIAKFAGIFAAIGMAVGFIGSALSALVKPWYTPLIAIAVLIIVISGPSMFIAWSKLRKRNLGPVLNANGWAINSRVLVNIVFGATLTTLAKYPKLAKAGDPFAQKKSPLPAIIIILLLLAGVFAALYFTGNLAWLGL